MKIEYEVLQTAFDLNQSEGKKIFIKNRNHVQTKPCIAQNSLG